MVQYLSSHSTALGDETRSKARSKLLLLVFAPLALSSSSNGPDGYFSTLLVGRLIRSNVPMTYQIPRYGARKTVTLGRVLESYAELETSGLHSHYFVENN